MVRLLYFTILFLLTLSAYGREITVSTAMGMREFVGEVSREFSEKTGVKVYINAASSGKLIKQIEAGAPVDVYISANKFWMEYGTKRGLIDGRSVRDLAETKLVLVAPKNSKIDSFEKAEKIAVGNELAPIGKYAIQALKNLKVYNKIREKLVFSPNVRQIAVWTMTGNADLGIIYYSDYLKLKDKLKLVQILPDNLHSPIIFTIGCVKGKREKLCREFENFILKLPEKEYEKFGFKKAER